MIVDVLVPTLGRSHALAPVLESLLEHTPSNGARLLWVIDHDDRATREAIDELPHGASDVLVHDGTYPTKINAGFQVTKGPLVLPTADDVLFHVGWYEAAVEAFTDGVQVVGTDDLSPATVNRDHATMPIVRRAYCWDPGAAFNELGTVFHEGYRHNFCETELWQLALHRGVTAWAEGAVIEHCHPAWGKRETDETDRRGNLRGWDHDHRLFESRRRAWQRSK